MIRNLSRRDRRRWLRRLGIFVPFALVACSAQATDLYWRNPVSGLWGAGANWTDLWSGNPYIPGAGDRAFIGLDAPINAWTVTLNADVTIDALFSHAALKLAGHSLSLATASTIDGDLDLTGSSLQGLGTLTTGGATTLSGATLGTGGTLTLNGAVSLIGERSTFDRDVIATGTTTWRSDFDGNSGRIDGTGTFTNTGTLNVESAQFTGIFIQASFVNAGTVNGDGSASFSGPSFANSGTFLNEGWETVVQGDTFTNTGLIKITNGGLTLDTTTNSNAGGTIRMDGGTAQLNGNWATAGLGTLVATNNGRIFFGGTLDNVGAALDLSTVGITRFGGYSSNGILPATVEGGDVSHTESLGEGSYVVFDGANIVGPLDLRGNNVTLQNGTTLGSPSIRLTAASLSFADADTAFDGTLTARGIYSGAANGLSVGNLILGSNSVVEVDPAATDTVKLSVVASGDVTNRGAIRTNSNGVVSFFLPFNTFRNEGTLTASATETYYGAPLSVETYAFVNTGSISLTQGTRGRFVGSGTFDNAGGSIALNGSALDFGGDTTRAGLGTVIGANGSKVRYVSGTLDLTGGTFSTQGFGGSTSFALAGGTLKDGSVVQSANIGDGFGGLDHVTLDAAPTFRGRFVVSNGLLFPGSTITLAGGGIDFAGVQTFGGTIIGDGSLGFKSGTFTQLVGGLIRPTNSIGSSFGTGNADFAGTVQATSGRSLFLRGATITTQTTGLISGDGAFTRVRLDGENVVHNGVLRATSGASVGLVANGGSWTSAGSAIADGTNSVATFGGNTTLETLGTLTATNGGRIRYAAGTFDLGGTSYDLRSVGELGAFGLSGGAIANGGLLGTALLNRNGRGGLRNVTLDADLDLRNFTLNLSGALSTPTGALRMENSSLRAVDSASPMDYATTGLDAYGYNALSATGALSLSGLSTVHTGASLAVAGDVVNSGSLVADGGFIALDGYSSSLVNSGTIRATNGGQASLNVNQSMVNSGALLADAGGRISLNMETGWQNAGTVTADGIGSQISAYGDTDHDTLAQTTLRNGGQLYLAGSVTAPGTTFDLASFGPRGAFGLADARMQVATVANSDLLATNSRGTLIGDTTFDKGLKLESGSINAFGNIDLGGGALSLSGYSQVFVDGMRHVGSISLDNSYVSTGDLTLTSGGDVTLKNQSNFSAIRPGNTPVSVGTITLDRGSFGASPLTIQQLDVLGGGQFENSVSGAQMTLGGLSVASGAGLSLRTEEYLTGHARLNGDASIDGGVYNSILDAYGGTVSGNGYVQSLSLRGGTLSPGHSPGTMQTGAFTMDATSHFLLEIGGSSTSGLFDKLNTATASLNGILDLSLVGGYTPEAGTWRFLTASSSLNGTFSTRNLGVGWSYGQNAGGAFVSYAPVPEPATLAALGLGIAAFAQRRRR